MKPRIKHEAGELDSSGEFYKYNGMPWCISAVQNGQGSRTNETVCKIAEANALSNFIWELVWPCTSFSMMLERLLRVFDSSLRAPSSLLLSLVNSSSRLKPFQLETTTLGWNSYSSRPPSLSFFLLLLLFPWSFPPGSQMTPRCVVPLGQLGIITLEKSYAPRILVL